MAADQSKAVSERFSHPFMRLSRRVKPADPPLGRRTGHRRGVTMALRNLKEAKPSILKDN